MLQDWKPEGPSLQDLMESLANFGMLLLPPQHRISNTEGALSGHCAYFSQGWFDLNDMIPLTGIISLSNITRPLGWGG